MRSIINLCIILSLAVPLWAAGDLDQLPPGKWWDNPMVVEKLALSDEQHQAISEKIYSHALQMIDLKAAVERAELTLREAADRPKFDAAALRRAFAAFQEARQQLESERFEMLLSVRQVLDIAQWHELQQLRQQFERRHGRMGRSPEDRPHRGGGFDGPPRPRQ